MNQILNGIICVDKPKGITSFDVVRKLKKILKEKKIGHTGTLDPLATGVMILCIGKGTKLVQDLEGKNKNYIAEFQLGFKTDTYDIEGKITEKKEFDSVSLEELENVLNLFKGEIEQEPPMYSALKQNGKRLYELARKGIVVERKKRKVNILEISVLEFDGRKGKIHCSVSKGTYIRSLIYDMGIELGCFATMTNLQRTTVGNTELEDCYTLGEIEKLNEHQDRTFLKGVEEYFNYSKAELLNEEHLKYYKNGNSFNYNGNDGYYSIYYDGEFIGLGQIIKNRLKGYKYY